MKQKTDRGHVSTSSMLNFLTLYALQAFATRDMTLRFLKHSATYAVLVQQISKKISSPLVGGLRGTYTVVKHFYKCRLTFFNMATSMR